MLKTKTTMTKRIKDVVFSRSFENNAGETKYFNTRIGSIIKNDNGSVMLKLDFIPTDINSGVMMLFDIQKPEDKPSKKNKEEVPF